ncbi:NAD+ synthase [Schumannella luteola]|uniref:Glutamine-dependent NAD(+) synthetase n=1 Tax=Schumannella luteola TaxID=472059 RepID=A0A852YEX2_9MICO|nr:NAD+ synthase [Schumannella luteola]NYG99850.1 NAD+ synthase (glutamine-hydrolyzing) [Schumannella luteola]TPX02215.1 NAD+ synthase [Schumannella luteola]
MPRLRLALAQTDPVVGDLAGNAEQLLAAARDAAAAGADILAAGEMALSGYPIEDLAAQPGFLRASGEAVTKLAARLDEAGLGELVVVVGHPDGPHSPRLIGTSNAPTAIAQNCASVLHRGRVVARYAKHHLPNYSVFDEYRVFIPGDELLVLRIKGVDVALIVCEDLWRDGGPVGRVLSADAGLLLVVNASPFERDKDEVRLPLVTRRAVETDTIVGYVNIVGGQDDLVFDGDSVVVDGAGEILARAPQFREHLLVVDVEPESATDTPLPDAVRRVEIDTVSPVGQPELVRDVAELPDDREQIWNALVLGLRDYVEKNRFPSVVLGLSGGIDSSVVAAIAADAIGADRVYGISMPSRYSSDGSKDDARELAERIGLHYSVEPIADLVTPIEEQLHLTGVAAENLQARIRGMIWMAASNSDGHLALTNGNKTEVSVGYSTIYGDAAGGFAPIKDVPKTLVWELARWRNAHALSRGEVEPIPAASIEKPPSAELRPDQTDQDTLPPYELLDEMLERYVTQRQGREELVEAGYDPETVDFVTKLVDRSEWKRRQGAIGPKISGMAFGRDRRLPITYRPTR